MQYYNSKRRFVKT